METLPSLATITKPAFTTFQKRYNSHHILSYLLSCKANDSRGHNFCCQIVTDLKGIYYKLSIKLLIMADYHTYRDCIDACLKCSAVCSHCASSCTQEEDIKRMAKCIQWDMECAAICTAAAQLMSLGSSKAKDICRICADICEQCGNECGKHQTEHCRECAEACRQCAEECRKMAA